MSTNDPRAAGSALSADLAERAAARAAAWTRADSSDAPVPQDRAAAAFAAALADGVLRPESVTAAAAALHRLAADVPDTLPWFVRSALQVGGAVAPVLPTPAVPLVRRAVRDVLAAMALDGRAERLGVGLEGLRARDLCPDLRLTGPAVLGDAAARRRVDGIRALVSRDDVDRISLTVGDVVSGLSPWSFDTDVERAAERLLPVYLDAAEAGVHVTLVAEGHDDLDLTVAVVTRVLEEPRLTALAAGIALPVAVPESLGALRELAAWARLRVAVGGARLTVRLSDLVPRTSDAATAARHGWPTPAATDAGAVDVLLVRALRDATGARAAEGLAVEVETADAGRAALALALGDESETPMAVAVPLAVAWRPERPPVVIAPVVHPDDLDAVAGALASRAAEGVPVEGVPVDGPFEEPDTSAEAGRLRRAIEGAESPAPEPRAPRRGIGPAPAILREPADADAADGGLTQAVLGIAREAAASADTSALAADAQQMLFGGQAFVDTAVFSLRENAELVGGVPGFRNVADTDPTVAADRAWARDALARADASTAGDATAAAGRVDDGAALDAVIARVREGAEQWGALAAADRAAVLLSASRALDDRRADLIEVLASEGGALLAEADVEVSQAVDAAAYYAATAKELDRVAGAVFVPDRVTVVAPRWSAPVGLCAAEVLAALAAGSGVVLTPPPRARRAAAVVAESLWAAGVPRDAFAYADLDEEASGRALVVHPGIDRVLLAGARTTAERFVSWRPELPMQALAAGSNAVIVAPSADVDAAVADIVAGAFAHAGQAPAASSFVILVGAMARSARFAEQLRDAVSSLRVGPASDPLSHVGPLIEEPAGDVCRALTVLADGERWLVQPRELDLGPETAGRFWTPGVRVGVHAGSHLSRAAVGAPVLGVLQAPTLARAVELQNLVGSGFVAGLHTRDAADLELWLDTVEAAVLRVNRATTGGVVQREPLGGWGESGVGPGAMSGGPNRLVALGSWRPSAGGPASSTLHLRGLDSRISTLIEAAQPTLDYEAFEWLRRGALSDAVAWDREFGRVKDVSRLGVERNLWRYRPADVAIRATADAAWQSVLRVLVAAVRSGSAFTLSTPVGLPGDVRHLLGDSGVPVSVESDLEWMQRVAGGIPDAIGSRPSRVRLVGPAASVAALRSALVASLGGSLAPAVYANEVTTAGRLELLPFLREQAISIAAFRHGRPDPWSADVI